MWYVKESEYSVNNHMLSLTMLPERSTEDKSHGWAFQVTHDSPVLL